MRDDPNVLLLSYEHMSAEREAHIRRVAEFCGIALDDELLALTLERTSFAFMIAHKDKFDDAMMRAMSERRANLPAGSDSAKVRGGRVGDHCKELPPDVSQKWDAIWAETVAPRTGFANYAELDAALRERFAR